MRKLLNFWHICLCYFLVVFVFICSLLFFSALVFVLPYYLASKNIALSVVYFVLLILTKPNIWFYSLSDKTNRLSIYFENKAKKIKEKESEILNADNSARLLKGEILSYKPKKVSWIKEIVVTLFLTGIILLIFREYLGYIAKVILLILDIIEGTLNFTNHNF